MATLNVADLDLVLAKDDKLQKELLLTDATYQVWWLGVLQHTGIKLTPAVEAYNEIDDRLCQITKGANP